MFSKPNKNLNHGHQLRPLDRLNIKSIQHLALNTGVPEAVLIRMAETPDKFFRVGHFTDKKGKRRPKAEPIGPLAVFQPNLNKLLQRVKLPVSVHGGPKGRSYITNAEQHIDQPVVMAFDIRSFFPSVKRQHVFRTFHERLGCSPPVADLISRLTTLNDELAQGASASTIIAAIVAEPILKRIQNLVIPEGGLATIYVDDIAISGPSCLARHKSVICSIINQSGFTVHMKKVRVMRAKREQVVTGVAVNTQLDLPAEKMTALWNSLRTFERAAQSASYPSLSDLVSLQNKAKHLKVLNPGSGTALLRRVGRLIRSHPLENEANTLCGQDCYRQARSGRPSAINSRI